MGYSAIQTGAPGEGQFDRTLTEQEKGGTESASRVVKSFGIV
ncbi:hypothetical protein [Nocardia farcinica]